MKRSASRIVVSALIVLIGLVALGAVPRLRQSTALQRAAASPVTPALVVVTPSRAPATADFTLPGNIQAIQDVPIFARADGYLKRRFVDIGDRVRPGQVLAEIDTPELDQQVAQGRAALAQAQASLAQAQSALQQARATLQHSEATMRFDAITLARWRQLKSRELVAQQDVDNFQAASDGSRADVDAAKANLTTTTDAQDAIDSLDTAIKDLSTARATLGAYQNRFEHTINNLNVQIENLSASKSAITDTDMAQEMVKFTRSQILSQAGTAMLAQANQAPQNVLQLLRG